MIVTEKKPRQDWRLSVCVFQSRVIRRSVSPRFIELCMETPCWCTEKEQKHGAIEFSVVFKQNVITLEPRQIEVNTCSWTRTDQSFDLHYTQELSQAKDTAWL